MNFDLYIADYLNHRVQLWRSGESNGITVAGNGSPNPTIDLDHPTAVVLDAGKYLFIVDSANDRIVGSGLNGFRCLVGCFGKWFTVQSIEESIRFEFRSFWKHVCC